MDMTLAETVARARSAMAETVLPEGQASWAMHRDSCRFLSALISVTGSVRVLEFGSGFSTRVIGRTLSGRSGSFILSVDDSGKYSSAAREAYIAAGCGVSVEFVHAPLRPRLYGARLLMGYSAREIIASNAPFDIALIDAPHHDYGRESVFYDALPSVRPGGLLVLDDANRAGMEMVYVETWKKSYGSAIEVLRIGEIGNGLCVIRKVRDSSPAYPAKGAGVLALRTVRNCCRYLSRWRERACAMPD